MEEILFNKKLLIVVASIIAFLAIALLATSIIIIYINNANENARRKAIINKSNDFIALWGTYNYKTFPDYKNEVKTYMAPGLFEQNFSNQLSLDIRKGRMVTDKYSITTKPIKPDSVNKPSDTEYVIGLTVSEKVVSSLADENYQRQRSVSLTWDKQDNNFKITKISYSP